MELCAKSSFFDLEIYRFAVTKVAAAPLFDDDDNDAATLDGLDVDSPASGDLKSTSSLAQERALEQLAKSALTRHAELIAARCGAADLQLGSKGFRSRYYRKAAARRPIEPIFKSVGV